VVKPDVRRRGAAADVATIQLARARIIRRIPISTTIPRWRSPSSSGRARTRSTPPKGIIDRMAELSKRFPPGVKYAIVYNPTQFIQQSVNAVIETIGEAIVLVILVVILFLQTWRAAIIPLVAIPVFADRQFLLPGDVRLFAEQSDAVRAGAGDRHRGRRRESSLSKMSNATSRPAFRRATPRAKAWTRSARR